VWWLAMVVLGDGVMDDVIPNLLSFKTVLYITIMWEGYPTLLCCFYMKCAVTCVVMSTDLHDTFSLIF
jgi:hypothetical protein